MENNEKSCITPDSIKDLLSELAPLYHAEQERQQKEKEKGKSFNIFSTLALCSDEVRLHSRFLAALLNPNADHGLGNEFLKAFLKAIDLPDDYIQHCKEDIVERYIGEETEAIGGRVDIILEDVKQQHAVIIENKIYARDQPNQLLRYYNYGKKRFGKDNFKLVYLTLDGHEPSKYSLGGEEIELSRVSYSKDILKLLESFVQRQPSKPVSRSIEDYIEIIKLLTHQDMDTKYQQDIIRTAINEIYIDVTLELLKLSKNIGDKLIEEYIIKPLLKEDFKQIQNNNGALQQYLDKGYAIVIKTDNKTDDKPDWKDVWIGIILEDENKQIPCQMRLACFTDEPTMYCPYGWSWISDKENNDWHDPAEFSAIKNGEVLRWIENKIRKIKEEFKTFSSKQ